MSRPPPPPRKKIIIPPQNQQTNPKQTHPKHLVRVCSPGLDLTVEANTVD